MAEPISAPILRRADYRLSEEEQALAEAFSAFFERSCPSERVRAAEPWGFDAALWAELAPMRPVAMGLPESLGGDGAGLVELVLVTEPFGRSVAPVPLVEAAVAARLLAAVATAAPGGPADAWVNQVIDEHKVVTLALQPGGGPQLVPAGAVADAVVGLLGDELVLGVCPAERAARRPRNHGFAPIAWCDLSDPECSFRPLWSGPSARAAFERAVREWKLLMASALIGMAQATLDIGVEHARSRVAFGAPIGSFQAVSHALADVAMAVETGRRLVRKGAWYAAHEPDEDVHRVLMAYRYATQTAMTAATVGVHVLGGVGFTVESDPQLYFRRVKGWTLVAGDPKAALSDIADALFGPVAIAK